MAQAKTLTKEEMTRVLHQHTPLRATQQSNDAAHAPSWSKNWRSRLPALE